MFRFLKSSVFLFVLLISLTTFSYSAEKNALVIIDMQLGFVTRGGNDKDPENIKKVQGIISNQIEAIKLARQAKIPIIFIEYEGFGESNGELRKAAEGYADVVHFVKNSDGMFESYNKSRSKILDYLKDKDVKTLIITGANGGACVRASIDGSLSNNYNVVALSKAIADFNYKEFIYPYEKKYHFNPTCESCKFREVDDMEIIAFELSSTLLNKKKNAKMDEDFKREPKAVIPTGGVSEPLNNSAASK